MDSLPIITLIIGLLLGLGIIYISIKRSDQDVEIRTGRYRLLFIIGFIWTAVGVSENNEFFWILGSIFALIGLANKNRWKDELKYWDLPDSERLFNVYIGLGIVVLMIFGFAYSLLK